MKLQNGVVCLVEVEEDGFTKFVLFLSISVGLVMVNGVLFFI